MAPAAVGTLFIEPRSPWENGYVVSFNGKLGIECLNLEDIAALAEAKVLIEQWWKEYKQIRPHSTLEYRLTATEAILPLHLGFAALHLAAIPISPTKKVVRQSGAAILSGYPAPFPLRLWINSLIASYSSTPFSAVGVMSLSGPVGFSGYVSEKVGTSIGLA